MTYKEYGEVIEPAKQQGEFKEFGKVISPLSRTKSLINAPAKGAVKRAGDIAGFVQDLVPSFIPKGPLTQEKAHKYADENLPTFDREPEKFLERTGGVATEALLSPGGLAAKAVQVPLGAGLGYAAEKFGAPEWVQSIAEGAPFFYSGGKKIPLKPSQKKLGEFMRENGLTEQEIAVMLKTPEQVNRWGKWAIKGEKNSKLMESIYHKTGKIYDGIKTEAGALGNKFVTPEAGIKFLNDTSEIIKDMPHKYRSIIKQDAIDLLNSGGDFNAFTNFYHDVNAVIGSESGGKAIVGRIKKPVMEAIESINPKLASDFQLANDLFRTRANVKGALVNPKDFDKLMDLGEGLGLAQGIANRDSGMIAKVVGMSGWRYLAGEMLTNPRLQNKATRIAEALKKNKYMLAEKYTREIIDETGLNEYMKDENQE